MGIFAVNKLHTELKRPQIMGIVNLTDNSFVEFSRMGEVSGDELLSYADRLFSDGADIIDIGACSTAPGNDIVSESVEMERIRRGVPLLFESFPDRIFSVDTFRTAVAAECLEIANKYLKDPREQLIINDISSGSQDSSMLSFIAQHKLQYIAMADNSDPRAFFTGFIAAASRIGVDRWILDPGFGFGKTLEQNWEVLHNLSALKVFGRPILAALSRKRMIWQPLGLTPSTCAQQSVDAEKLAAQMGADMIRTHDVAAHHQESFDISK